MTWLFLLATQAVIIAICIMSNHDFKALNRELRELRDQVEYLIRESGVSDP